MDREWSECMEKHSVWRGEINIGGIMSGGNLPVSLSKKLI